MATFRMNFCTALSYSYLLLLGGRPSGPHYGSCPSVCLSVPYVTIIIINNVTYMAQIRINAANIDCYVYCSSCRQKCFQPSTKHRQ